MNLAAAVNIYVLHRRAMGQKFDGPTVALRAFSRRCGNRSLQGIAPSEVKQFRDIPQTGPAGLAAEDVGFCGTFSRTGDAAGKVSAVPMPLASPKYTQTFVPYIYCRRELRLLLDAVPRCQRHAACRTSETTLRTCCCSSTELVFGWVKR